MSLVFLFVLELQFTVDHPLSNIICRMYGIYTVKYFQKFGKLNLNIPKNEADLMKFPKMCFLRFFNTKISDEKSQRQLALF